MSLIDELERKKYRRVNHDTPKMRGGGRRRRAGAFFYRGTSLGIVLKGTAARAAAYRSRTTLRQLDGTAVSYEYKDEISPVVYSKITLPEGADEKFLDRQTLWSEAEAAEKNRVNYQHSRDFTTHIPPELQDPKVVQEIIDEHSKYLASFGFAVDANVHAPGKDSDERNLHAHFMITDRPIEGDHFTQTKTEFRKYRGPTFVKKVRREFAHTLNRQLERGGHELRVDPRKNVEQFHEALDHGDFELARELAQPATPRLPRFVIEKAKQGEQKYIDQIAERDRQVAEEREERIAMIDELEQQVARFQEQVLQVDQEFTKHQEAEEHFSQLATLTEAMRENEHDPEKLRELAQAAHDQFVQPEIDKHLPALTAPLREKLVELKEDETPARAEKDQLDQKLDKLKSRGAIGRTFSVYDTDVEIRRTEKKIWQAEKQLEQFDRQREDLESQIDNVKVDPSLLTPRARNFQLAINTAREQAQELDKTQHIQKRHEREQQRENKRGKGPQLGE